MDRRSFFKRTVGTLTAALLFKQGLSEGTVSILVDSPVFGPGDIFHVPRTRENFIISSIDGGKVTFSRPLRNEVTDDDEIILIGNTGVEGNTARSGWLETTAKRCLFKGKEVKLWDDE